MYVCTHSMTFLRLYPMFDIATVLAVKSDSDVMFCLQSYPGLIIDRSLVY